MTVKRKLQIDLVIPPYPSHYDKYDIEKMRCVYGMDGTFLILGWNSDILRQVFITGEQVNLADPVRLGNGRKRKALISAYAAISGNRIKDVEDAIRAERDRREENKDKEHVADLRQQVEAVGYRMVKTKDAIA